METDGVLYKLSWAWILRIKTAAQRRLKHKVIAKVSQGKLSNVTGLEHSTQTTVEILKKMRRNFVCISRMWPNVSIQNCELVATARRTCRLLCMPAWHGKKEPSSFPHHRWFVALQTLKITILGNHQPNLYVWYITARLIPRYVFVT